MNHFLQGVSRAVAHTFTLPDTMLEIGSYQVTGQEHLPNLKSLFPDHEYQGMDMRKGPGVDIIANVEEMPMEDESVGTVIALNLFEHVRCFWKGFDEIYRVLRPGGAFFVSCPFFLHRHSYPNDYWRFTPDAFSYLLEKYPQKLIGLQGPSNKPLQIWALAYKAPAPVITAELHQQFKRAMQRFAYEPVPLWKNLRYSLASLISGKRPFDTFMNVNRWETIVLGNEGPAPSGILGGKQSEINKPILEIVKEKKFLSE